MGAATAEIAPLDAFRKKRNLADHDRARPASEAEVHELRAMASSLRNRVMDWVQKNHPELLES